MKKLLMVAGLALLTYACTAEVATVKKESAVKPDVITRSSDKDKALDHLIDGGIYELKGDYASAVLEYQDALRLDPQPGVHYAISKAYYRLNKLSLALQHVNQAVKGDSTNIDYNFLLAKIYNSALNVDSAEAVYERIIRLDSLNVNAYFNLGMIYEPNRPAQALEVYKKLLDITGPEWNVLVKIADLNERLGNVDETVETVEELVALNPASLELRKLLIESYLQLGEYEKALNNLNDALTLFPDDIELIEYKANALVKTENWEEGVREYKKLVENPDISFNTKIRIGSGFVAETINDSSLIPFAKEILLVIDADSTDWQVKAMLGELAIRQGQDSAAVDYFRQATGLAEYNSDVWIRLGGFLFDNGEFEMAADEMEKAVIRFPENFVINFILGFSYSQLQEHEKALPYLKKAVRLNPGDLNAISVYGFTLNQLNKPDEALVYLKQALQIDPENVQILGMVGLIYDSKEMWAECDASYEKALSLDSTNALVLNNYAYSLSERGERLDEALNMVKEAVEAEPENPSYLDTIGWVYFKLGDFGKAVEYLEKAVEFDETNATLLDHLGDAYSNLGNSDKAIEYWKASYESDPTNEEIKNKIDKGTP